MIPKSTYLSPWINQFVVHFKNILFSVFFGFVLIWYIAHTKYRHWNWRNLINNWKILNQGCFNNSKHFCPKNIPYESRNITRNQSLFYSQRSKVREETVSQKRCALNRGKFHKKKVKHEIAAAATEFNAKSVNF